MMQIVIDIPEESYIALMEIKDALQRSAGFEKFIVNGTPLPAGHGRLIDADKYRHLWVDTYDSSYGDECANLFKRSVDNADTVIEADGGCEMNIKEITRKYKESIQQARNTFISDLWQFLKENKLDGKVVRISDGSIGWLDLDNDLNINFYPMKKNGERSLNCRGWFSNENIINIFKPFDGGAE